ncbi:MAG: hypothetical protein A3E87_03045 [Gammaproteobacteria bacterium RIFCSPHIGHO2_12_FULL_35_23]|nr:MAG: hypothetical protein A3E87_03045 [Gammaproteobacteria bacterium RIFCSPHIGHO2_12_FULL_35_23]
MKRVIHKSVIVVAKHPTTHQLFRFGIVGSFAALTNFIIVVLLVEFGKLHPLTANVFAFMIAFQVSFYGHKLWTFSSKGKHLSSLTKFLIVSGFGFCLNESLYALFLQILKLHYIPALIVVLMIVPPITFTLSKFWAFAK